METFLYFLFASLELSRLHHQSRTLIGDDTPPKSLAESVACMPGSSTPPEPWQSCRLVSECCLPQGVRPLPPQRIFQASITLPTDPLDVIRTLAFTITTQLGFSRQRTLKGRAV